MIPPESVKSQVIDIRSRADSCHRTVVADANVLYYVNYDFRALASAGVELPLHYQTKFYPKWWTRAIGAGITLCSTATALAEFVHLVERMELQSLWVTDPHRPELDPHNPGQQFSPKYVKMLRSHYHDRLPVIRTNVETVLRSAQKAVAILPGLGSDADRFEATVREWMSSTADIGDATLVAEAKRAGLPHIISDDADFVSFDGITLYTANDNAVAAAAQSNTLIA